MTSASFRRKVRPGPPSRIVAMPCRHAVVLASALSLASCAPGHDVRFSGARSPAAASAKDLAQHRHVPHDHVPIGTVTARCLLEDSGRGACSELELLRALRTEAADAGGTAFVAPACRQQTESSQRWIHCEATVARRREMTEAGDVVIGKGVPRERQWEVSVDGHSVRITTVGSGGGGRAPRPVDQVRVVLTRASSGSEAGSVRADCVDRCARADAERGLLHGAAWLGADAVALGTCVERTPGRWSCSGEAFADEPGRP